MWKQRVERRRSGSVSEAPSLVESILDTARRFAQGAALSMAFVTSSSSIAPAAEATNRANAHRPKKRVDRRRRRRRRRLWAGPGLRTYVRTYVVFLHTYPSRPVHGVCRLWAGSGPVFFYVRTYVLRQEVRYFLRASVKEDECCLLHARLGVLVQRLLRARRGRAMAVRSDY